MPAAIPIERARDLARYLGAILAELQRALVRRDHAEADALAALFVGVERRADVRAARTVELGDPRCADPFPTFAALDERWRELRFRTRFPTEKRIYAAVHELAALPHSPTTAIPAAA